MVVRRWTIPVQRPPGLLRGGGAGRAGHGPGYFRRQGHPERGHEQPLSPTRDAAQPLDTEGPGPRPERYGQDPRNRWMRIGGGSPKCPPPDLRSKILGAPESFYSAGLGEAVPQPLEGVVIAGDSLT